MVETSAFWVHDFLALGFASGRILRSESGRRTEAWRCRIPGGSLSGYATPPAAKRIRVLARVLCVLFLGIFAASPSFGQSSAPIAPAPDRATKKVGGKGLKVDVDMALVNVTVTDPYGRLVTGLEQDNFRVYEDNAEQEIVRFSSEDVPISIGVIFDMSGSMADKFEKSRLAAVQFFKTANPQDEFCLVNFNDRAQLASPFTASVEELQDRLLYTSARGQTALFDGIYLGLSQMKGARNSKKALLIISDGGDNHSRYTEFDVRRFLKEADVQLYAIGIYEQGEAPTIEEKNGPALLTDMTEATGGRTFRVDNLSDLPDIASKISMELRNQYVLGYRPSNRARDGKWRKIKVRLRPPKGLPPLQIYARTGYFAPGH